MADVAYERVSTDRQSTERQRYVLTETGVTFDRTFSDPATSSRLSPLQRQGFSELMDYVREGDTVHVSEMFRLVRSVRDILDLLDLLHERGVLLKIHDGAFAGLDLTARDKRTGKLNSSVKMFVQVLASVGEFQRDLQRELTIDGVRAAEAAGRKGGRKPALSEQDAEAARTAHQNSGRSIASLAREYSVSRVAIRTALGLDAAPVAEGEVNDRGSANVREVSPTIAMPGALAGHIAESMRAAGPEAAKSPEYAPLVAAMDGGQTVRRGKGYALTISAPEEVLATIDGFAESIMFGNTVTPDSVKRAARQWKERRTA